MVAERDTLNSAGRVAMKIGQQGDDDGDADEDFDEHGRNFRCTVGELHCLKRVPGSFAQAPGVRYASYCLPAMIIQGTPNRSATMPKREAKKRFRQRHVDLSAVAQSVECAIGGGIVGNGK